MQVIYHVTEKVGVFTALPIVHKTARRFGFGNKLCHFSAVITESPYIVYHVRTCRNTLTSHVSFICVKRNRHVKSAFHRLNHRDNTFRFFIFGYFCVARTSRFSADVKNVHPLSEHLLNTEKSAVKGIESSPIRKGIGCYI